MISRKWLLWLDYVTWCRITMDLSESMRKSSLYPTSASPSKHTRVEGGSLEKHLFFGRFFVSPKRRAVPTLSSILRSRTVPETPPLKPLRFIAKAQSNCYVIECRGAFGPHSRGHGVQLRACYATRSTYLKSTLRVALGIEACHLFKNVHWAVRCGLLVGWYSLLL